MSTLISPSLGARQRTARRNVRGNPMHGPVLPVAALVRPHRPPHFTRSPGAPSKDAINSTWPDGLARATAHPYPPAGAGREALQRWSGLRHRIEERLGALHHRTTPVAWSQSRAPRRTLHPRGSPHRSRPPSFDPARHAGSDGANKPQDRAHPSCTPAAKAPTCKALVPFRGDSSPGTRRLRRHRRRRGRRPAHKRRAGRAAGSSSRHGPWPA